MLHVHDLVDFVSAESFKAGKAAADYVQGRARKGAYVALKDGDGVRGVVPQRLLKPEGEAQSVQVMFRPAGVYENATLCVMDGDREVLRQRKRILTPGEMAELTLKPGADRVPQRRGCDRVCETVRRRPVWNNRSHVSIAPWAAACRWWWKTAKSRA